jgi:transcriptional regulator with XRE-family HTH domain
MELMYGLKRLRKARGLTQGNLAAELGVEMNTVWKWENGKIMPSVETLQRLANFFDISVDELLNGPKKNEIEIRVIIEETDDWEVEKMELTSGGKDRFSVHIGPGKIGVEVTGKFETVEDLDAVFARARKCAEETLVAQGRLLTVGRS